MAKSNSSYLLIPGETEWESWTITPNQPTTLHSSYAVKHPSEIEKLPAGDLIFLFPVQALTALPLRVQTGDASLFPDLAATHAERVGLRPDPLAGQLTDIFPITTSAEESTLLSVVLRNPSTEVLPSKSPKAFDISARAFPTPGNILTLWRELNQWVFAIHQQGKLVYCQTTSSSGISPDANLIREIRIAIAQLSIQGIEVKPDKAIVWSNDTSTQTSALSQAFTIRVDLAPRPNPSLPNPLSKLLPADVRAARRAAQQRQNTTLAIAVLALFYLGTIGYFAYGLWESHSTTKKLQDRATAIAPLEKSFTLHMEKWDELELAISRDYNTVDIMDRIAKCIPPDSGLRLTVATLSVGDITLEGSAPEPQAVTQFSLKLNQSNDLVAYKWETPPPRKSKTTWDFTFKATIPDSTP
ncbi:MAG: hypothetical protein V4727_09560 [Verrucomicrobiota bacterium]